MADFKETKIKGLEGGVVTSIEDSDGQYHLATSIIQDVKEATGNSSSTNLASGETWTGEPITTLGVVGLQWNLNTDQNCTIYSEESEGSHTGIGTIATTATSKTLTGTSTTWIRSFVVGDTISVEDETDRIVESITSDTEMTVTVAMDNTDTGLSFTHYHWDISYPFEFKANVSGTGEGETVQATMAYWRLRVVNISPATTTFFRVSGILCPIATPLPSALSDDRRLKVETTITGRTNTERHAWINPTNEQATSPVYRMVGTNFDGTDKDTNFWTDGSLLDGSVAQAGGEIDLHTNDAGATAASSAKYTSVRKARFVAGSAQYFQGGFNFKTAATANNIRRVGAYTTTAAINTPVDGFYFELDNATFSVNSRANAETVNNVDSGSFNGELGLIWTPVADTYYSLTIEYTPLGVWFYVNGQLLHKMQGAHLSYFMTLPITMENLNTAGSTDISFECVGMYIARQGELVTAPATQRASGVSGTVFKYGAGNLRGMQISNVTDNADINIYDGTSTAGVLIWASGNLKKKEDGRTTSVDFFGAPFNDGLFVSIVDQDADVLIVYE